MKTHCHRANLRRALVCAWIGTSALIPVRADVLRTQTIELRQGWNAVFLEVEPPNTNPDAVFAGTPVDVVARYFPMSSPVQFISDPADAPWNKPGWGVWYSTNRPDAFLTSLHALHGNKACLVHATANHLWRVTGKVAFTRIRWQADSFNLLGFPVDEQAPPTFDRFFAGAGGLIGQRIYRLDNKGRWLPVTTPTTTTVRTGEAYWVYCQGRTDYQGPLDVKGPGLGMLDFGATGSTLQVDLLNTLSSPASVTVERVSDTGDLPLARVVRDLSTLQTSYPELAPVTALSSLEAGTPDFLRLQVRREAMTAAEQVCLLKLTSSQGVRFWIPVRAARTDLVAQP
jgi:hypothetical protein